MLETVDSKDDTVGDSRYFLSAKRNQRAEHKMSQKANESAYSTTDLPMRASNQTVLWVVSVERQDSASVSRSLKMRKAESEFNALIPP